MIDLIEQHRSELLKFCKKYSVRRLDVFGSATRKDFDRQQSDLDFVVEFDNLPSTTPPIGFWH